MCPLSIVVHYSFQNVRWPHGTVDMPTVHCRTIFFFFHPFCHLPHFLVLFPHLLFSLVSLFSPFTLPTSVVFPFISPFHQWQLQVPIVWYPNLPHHTIDSSSKALQGLKYPDPNTYHCKYQSNIIIMFSQNTTNNFISICKSGNMFRLIEPSSGQFTNHMKVHSVDVHIVGSKMFSDHMTIKGKFISIWDPTVCMSTECTFGMVCASAC